MPHLRVFAVIGLVLSLLLGPASRFGIAVASQHCRVQIVQGWHTGAGTATIVMRNVGAPCGGALYTLPQRSVAVDKIVVLVPPKNGTVTVEVPRFGYTPNQGFAGEDRFELSAEGPGPARGDRISLRGVVTVRVEP
jgi:hypothetical protein